MSTIHSHRPLAGRHPRGYAARRLLSMAVVLAAILALIGAALVERLGFGDAVVLAVAGLIFVATSLGAAVVASGDRHSVSSQLGADPERRLGRHTGARI